MTLASKDAVWLVMMRPRLMDTILASKDTA